VQITNTRLSPASSLPAFIRSNIILRRQHEPLEFDDMCSGNFAQLYGIKVKASLISPAFFGHHDGLLKPLCASIGPRAQSLTAKQLAGIGRNWPELASTDVSADGSIQAISREVRDRREQLNRSINEQAKMGMDYQLHRVIYSNA